MNQYNVKSACVYISATRTRDGAMLYRGYPVPQWCPPDLVDNSIGLQNPGVRHFIENELVERSNSVPAPVVELLSMTGAGGADDASAVDALRVGAEL